MISNNEPTTLGHTIVRAEQTAADVPLLFVSRTGRIRVTIGELIAQARRFAGGLAARGVKPGDPIAVQLPSCPEQAAVQVACMLLGAVYVPVVPILGAQELSATLADLRPRVLVTGTRWRHVDFEALLQGVAPELVPALVIFVGGRSPLGESFDELAKHPPLDEAAERLPDADCLVIYTSGSSDTPKGVRHTHTSVLAEAQEWQYLPAVTQPGTLQILQATGAGHIGGFMYLVRALRHGVGTCVLDWWDTALALECITGENISVLPCTSHHLATILDLAAAQGSSVSGLERVILGGGPVPPALIRRADDTGVTAVRGYGLSEHPTATIGSFDDPLEVRAQTDGRLTGSSVMRIVDEDGRTLAAGETGEILLRGGEQCAGYTNHPQADAFTDDGWLRTGDLGFLSTDGYLSVVDRKKNIIIRGGENISIAEVEREISEHPDVEEVAAFGIPHDTLGEIICASMVRRPRADATAEQVREFLIERGIARQKMPAHLEFVTELPKGGLQKIRRKAVRQDYLDRHGAEPQYTPRKGTRDA